MANQLPLTYLIYPRPSVNVDPRVIGSRKKRSNRTINVKTSDLQDLYTFKKGWKLLFYQAHEFNLISVRHRYTFTL